MSLDSYRREVQRHREEIARLQKAKAEEARKSADLGRRANEAASAASRASSPSSVQSKLRDVERYERDRARAEERVADFEKRLAQEHERLSRAEERLSRAETDEAKKRQSEADRRRREAEHRDRQVSERLTKHDALHAQAEAAIRRLESLPQRIVVLVLAANPLDGDQLRLDEEVRSITEMIRKAKHRDAVKLESCWAVRPQDVLQAINEHKPTVVHFSGHGSDTDEIVFQDDAGMAKLVSKDAMVQLMRACSGDIRLVFFNTCYSQAQAEAVVQHVEAAIGMKSSIGDDVARTFSSQFYSAIGFGHSVGKAFEQARALVMMEGLGQDDVPELFTRSGMEADKIVLVRPSESECFGNGLASPA